METKMPFALKEKIKNDIHQRLNPSWTKVFMRLALVQFFASFFVLLICPQFNLGFFPHSFLGHIFMSWGDFACNLACGAIFIGTGMFIALFVLTNDEIRVLRSKSLPSFSLLSVASLLAFMVFGVQFQFVLFFAWLLGALVSAIVGLEVYWNVKRSA